MTDRGSPDNCGTPRNGCAAPLTSPPATVLITVEGTAVGSDFEPDLGLPLNLDDDSALVELPFSFPFLGNTYTQVYINSNGNLTFDQANYGYTEDRQVFLTGAASMIAPFWDDLNPEVAFLGEVDYYSFTGNSGDSISAKINADRSGSDLDSILTLFDSGGNILARNDDFFGYDSLIEDFVLPYTGTFFLQVVDYSQEGGPQFFYTLTLARNGTPLVSAGEEIEPNSTIATATPIVFGNVINGVIAVLDDSSIPLNVFANGQLPGRFIVTWNLVPEYFDFGSNTVQAVLFNDGTIQVIYAGVSSEDAILGMASPTGSGFIEVDYSSDTPFSTSGPIAIFEEFTGPVDEGGKPFDLDSRTLMFIPNSNGGYDVTLSSQ